MMNILLADYNISARWALRTMLEEEPGIESIVEAVDVESLFELSEKLHPDLILIDRELPSRPIEDVIADLHLLDAKIIVIVMSIDPGYERMLLKAGADAYVSKVEQPDWLLRSLRKYTLEKQKNDSVICQGRQPPKRKVRERK
jgi:DNA-binding NarL/FixJ family response regulator